LSLGMTFGRMAMAVAAVAFLVDFSTLLLRRKALGAKRGGVPVRVHHVGKVDHGVFVVVGPSTLSNHPGDLVLWDHTKTRSILLGPPEPAAEAGGLVQRKVQSKLPADLHAWTEGFLYGHIGQTPADMDLAFEDVTIGERAFPSWIVRSPLPQTNADRWAIHIHGLGGARNQALRGLPVFARSGFHSLVPSYDVSLEVKGRRKQSTLGLREWRAIAEAQDFVVSQGATQIVYVGWSFGALLALRVRQEKLSHLVTGLVLMSPALDWHKIVPQAMRRAGIPRFIVRVVMARFNSAIPRWGCPKSAWEEESRCVSAAAAIPVLVTHGTADTTVPLEHAQESIQGLKGPVQFVDFPGAQHGLEWNSNPALWEATVEEWLSSHCLEVSQSEAGLERPGEGL
jgi:uncharacterized protein